MVIDGHNYGDIVSTLDKLRSDNGKPKAIIADTVKGKYFPKIENEDNWHGKALGDSAEEVITHLKTFIKHEKVEFKTYAPEG